MVFEEFKHHLLTHRLYQFFFHGSEYPQGMINYEYLLQLSQAISINLLINPLGQTQIQPPVQRLFFYKMYAIEGFIQAHKNRVFSKVPAEQLKRE